MESGLTPEIVETISREKNDPDWMREFRLKSLAVYNKTPLPTWGPPIDGLHMENIVTYVRPKTEMRGTWDEVPDDIKNTFDTARISGMLDRVYLRELTLQIMVIYNYESEVNSRSENETIKSDTASDMENLNTVYNQFSEYKDLSS